jgi:hypothetical protein
MASGNQTWEKNWAALIVPDVTRQKEKKVIKCRAQSPTKM